MEMAHNVSIPELTEAISARSSLVDVTSTDTSTANHRQKVSEHSPLRFSGILCIRGIHDTDRSTPCIRIRNMVCSKSCIRGMRNMVRNTHHIRNSPNCSNPHTRSIQIRTNRGRSRPVSVLLKE